MRTIHRLGILATANLGLFVGIIARGGGPVGPSDGTLLAFDRMTTLPSFWLVKAAARLVSSDQGQVLQINFEADKAYPRLEYNTPSGGWDLSKFGGVKADVSNVGTTPVRVQMQVLDDSKEKNLNVSTIDLAPGKSGELKIIFGRSDGGTSDPIDPARVSHLKLQTHLTTQPSTIQVGNIVGWGTAADHPDLSTYSHPADRDKTVPLPDWVGTRPPVPGDWVQTMDENFKGDHLNDQLWKCSDKTDTYSPLALWTADNVIVADGELKLRTQKQQIGKWPYTSGQVIGFGKWAQLYGYFEAKTKFPTAKGTFPAFWMMPDRDPHGPSDQQSIWNRNTTKRGGMEFDIMEHLVGGYGPGRFDVGLHWDGYGADHKTTGADKLYYAKTPDDWHVFGMLWEPGKVTFYCDGKQCYDWEDARIGSVSCYFLLSAQMGGWFPEDKKVEDDKLPVYTEFKYVRAWQLRSRLSTRQP